MCLSRSGEIVYAGSEHECMKLKNDEELGTLCYL